MLTLSRRYGESIMIGKDIKITIKRHDRNQVFINIEADKSIPIYREEVYLKILSESGIELDKVDFRSEEYKEALPKIDIKSLVDKKEDKGDLK